MSTMSAHSTPAIVTAAAVVTARSASPRSCRPLGGLHRSPRALIKISIDSAMKCSLFRLFHDAACQGEKVAGKMPVPPTLTAIAGTGV
ncbi:hypothetical protein [Rhodococcus pyridinivorans]|uniref:hypothetical protein n=1 Tax=Rhodococcus pyridinivorans TaxID=103816 RepID=UPI003530A957